MTKLLLALIPILLFSCGDESKPSSPPQSHNQPTDLPEPIRNQLPGHTEILSLVKEGSIVKTGEILVELDANPIDEAISAAEIALESSAIALGEQEERIEVMAGDNLFKVRDAELAVELARQDRLRYVDGQGPQLRKKADTAVSLANEELRRATDRLNGTRKLEAKGYVNSTELVTDTLAVRRRQVELETSIEDRRLLLTFDHPRKTREYDAAFQTANLKLERLHEQNARLLESAKTQLAAANELHDRQQTALADLRSAKQHAIIRAPYPGRVSHEKSTDPPVAEGSLVRERQPLIILSPLPGDKIPSRENILAKTPGLSDPG